MSSFSSVIQKPGKKIVPKAAPRRNVQRKLPTLSVPASIDTQSELQNDSQDDVQVTETISTNAREVQPEQVEREQDDTTRPSQPPTVSETPSLTSVSPLIPDASFEKGAGVSTPSIILEPEPRATALTEDLPPVHRLDSSISKGAERTQAPVEDITQTQSSSRGESRSNEESSPAFESQPSIRSSSVAQPQPRRESTESEADTSVSRKRRRITPQIAAEIAPSQDVASTPTLQSSLQNHIITRGRSSQSQPPQDLLESATRRAASVSQLANDIDLQTRSLQHRGERDISGQNGTNVGTQGVLGSVSPPLQRGRERQKKTLQAQALEVVANAVGNSSASAGQRRLTPENADEYELEPTKTKMSELCEDRGLGKKSALETEMQANWLDIVQRRKEDRERALANAEKRRRRGIGQKHQLNLSEEPVAALAPAMAVVNGVIVVDQASREIDRGAQLQQAAFQDLDNVREDKDYYKYVNQGTVGIKPGYGQHTRWDEESNERFFQGLRMFGTDFLMIANMFPGLTRKQIKSKFIREENADKARIQDCLRNRQPVQLEDYASMANKEIEEFQTLESIQKELDEQEKRLRDEDNERRKREGFVAATDGTTQQPMAETTEGGSEGQAIPTEPGRFDAMAREIVEAAAGPKKRQRKTTTMNSKRGPKGGRRLEGGIEEVLGNIHEVAV